MTMDFDGWEAATAAAMHACSAASEEASEAFAEMLEATFADEGAEFVVKAFAYLRQARTARPEDVFIMGARKKLHLLPEGSFASLSDEASRFFRVFTACAKGIIAEYDVVKPKAVQPASFGSGGDDTIFENAYAEPGLLVTRPESAPPVVRQPGGPISTSGAPTMAEFMAMTPEQRRPFAEMFGMESVREWSADKVQEFLGRAPEPTRRITPVEFAEIEGAPLRQNKPAASRSRAKAKAKS